MSDAALSSVAVCLAAVLPYLSTIHNYFVADDFGVVQLLSGKPALYFPRWFVSSWMDQIWGFNPDEVRPFVAATYQVAALWGAAAPEANHLLNIALHAATGLLVLATARRVVGLGPLAATFAAVVFVVFPFQAETVAWITGRVDSMPAFFYLATFLSYARWRASGGPWRYLGSLGLFFIALFCKQNTITLPATIVLYDVIARRRMVRLSWAWVWPYLPYVVLTAGYLGIRYILFGEVARESQLSLDTMTTGVGFLVRHLQRSLFGTPEVASRLAWAMLGIAALGLWWQGSRSQTGRLTNRAALVLYFGPVWWAIGVAPILVAGYESPRHIYLATVGWAIVLGLGLETLQTIRTIRIRHVLTWALGGALIALYLVQLWPTVGAWNRWSSVSRKAVADLEREALAVPEGTLLIVSAPVRSWEWSVPFVAQPPYTRSDLTKRVFLLSPWLLHCCRSRWWDDSRRTLDAWSARRDLPPVVVLRWDPGTGALSRIADKDEPALRPLMETLRGTDTIDTLNSGILRIADRLAVRP